MMKISFRNSEDTPSLSIVRLDHLVLTVRDIGKTLSFYEKILGMKPALVRRRPALPLDASKNNLNNFQECYTVEPWMTTPQLLRKNTALSQKC